MTRPTAWIAEGLLGYLPPDGQDRLLDRIGELSSPGSRLAAEAVPTHRDVDDVDREELRERMKESTEVTDYLRERGWSVDGAPANELLTGYGLTPLSDDEGFGGFVVHVSATRER